MNSNWQIPLPLDQYLNHRVVIYFFSDGLWVPIKYCNLSKAIDLHYKTLIEANKEFFVFPVDLNPNNFHD
ncbi:hypothetical protein EH233_17925 [Anabaena sp. YBS01]|nr:hypothetical protein EH233_17925 [Anabaena sp. YBS01]